MRSKQQSKQRSKHGIKQQSKRRIKRQIKRSARRAQDYCMHLGDGVIAHVHELGSETCACGAVATLVLAAMLVLAGCGDVIVNAPAPPAPDAGVDGGSCVDVYALPGCGPRTLCGDEPRPRCDFELRSTCLVFRPGSPDECR